MPWLVRIESRERFDRTGGTGRSGPSTLSRPRARGPPVNYADKLPTSPLVQFHAAALVHDLAAVDMTGFGVRVYPNGIKIYVAQTRVGGKSKRITVDRHCVISPDQAQHKAAQMIAHIRSGEDPNPEAANKPTGPTVTELTEQYLVEHVEVRSKPRMVETGRWLVKKFVLSDLGDIATSEVEREHITDLHLKHRNTSYQANPILGVVQKVFNLAETWCPRNGGGNPCGHVQKYSEKNRGTRNRRSSFVFASYAGRHSR